jgi:hypothetical protein
MRVRRGKWPFRKDVHHERDSFWFGLTGTAESNGSGLAGEEDGMGSSDRSKGLTLGENLTTEGLVAALHREIRQLVQDDTVEKVDEIFLEARNLVFAQEVKSGKAVEFIARRGTPEKPVEEKLRGRPIGRWLAYVAKDKNIYHIPTGKSFIGRYPDAKVSEVIFLGREILRVVPEEILKISDEHQFVAELRKIDNEGFTKYVMFNEWKNFTSYAPEGEKDGK